jgi:hypothetical protein
VAISLRFPFFHVAGLPHSAIPPWPAAARRPLSYAYAHAHAFAYAYAYAHPDADADAYAYACAYAHPESAHPSLLLGLPWTESLHQRTGVGGKQWAGPLEREAGSRVSACRAEVGPSGQ